MYRPLRFLLATPFTLSLSIPVSWAHPGVALPEVSTGSNPYRSFPSDGELRTTLIPPDQDFIITLVSPNAGIWIDGVAASISAFASSTPGPAALYTGHGKLRVPAGSELRTIEYIQGHFVQAGSPYRFASGEVTGSSSPTDFKPIFTADSDRDFVISSMAIRDYRTLDCDLYLDGSLYLRSSSYLMSPGYESPYDFVGGLAMGKGALVVPAGSTLQIVNFGSLPCFYYLDGEYIKP